MPYWPVQRMAQTASRPPERSGRLLHNGPDSLGIGDAIKGGQRSADVTEQRQHPAVYMQLGGQPLDQRLAPLVAIYAARCGQESRSHKPRDLPLSFFGIEPVVNGFNCAVFITAETRDAAPMKAQDLGQLPRRQFLN